MDVVGELAGELPEGQACAVLRIDVPDGLKPRGRNRERNAYAMPRLIFDTVREPMIPKEIGVGE